MEDAFEQMEFKNDVIFTGKVSESYLSRLYASAFALLYISRFEGFGIPIIEAMKSNIPVITSNTTSMPEVTGDAALLADPDNVEGITTQMLALDDNAQRRQLIEAGSLRAKMFTWDRTANLLWQSIEKAITTNHYPNKS